MDVNISGVGSPDICLVADMDIMPVKPLWKYKPDWREKFVKERNNEKIHFYRIGMLHPIDF